MSYFSTSPTNTNTAPLSLLTGILLVPTEFHPITNELSTDMQTSADTIHARGSFQEFGSDEMDGLDCDCHMGCLKNHSLAGIFLEVILLPFRIAGLIICVMFVIVGIGLALLGVM